MFMTNNEYYNSNQDDYRILLECVKAIGDMCLYKKVLNISSNLSGQKITEYARIAQNIAIKQKRGHLAEALQMAHLVY